MGHDGGDSASGIHSAHHVTLAEALRDGARRLVGSADNPRLEARILLLHACGLTLNDLVREPDRRIDPHSYNGLIARRVAREPLALIVGHREFWSLDFLVSPVTLIPRPETETLVEAALAIRPTPRTILDLGTGTGCLLLSLLNERPATFGIGVDRSIAAVALAKANATRLGLTKRAAFLAGDWTSPLMGEFDLVVSNPPYIRHGDIDALMPEVARFEPRGALDGGEDGFDAYRAILTRLPRHLSSGGVAILELGIGQAAIVANLARDMGFESSLRLDFAHTERALVLKRPNR